jgi:hypothetical protein
MARYARQSLYSEGITFEPDRGNKKYIALIPQDNGKVKKVKFGSKYSAQYRDTVPLDLGGGIYSMFDHNDKKRRDAYHKRHGNIKLKDGSLAFRKKFSPSWFSWYFLWS